MGARKLFKQVKRTRPTRSHQVCMNTPNAYAPFDTVVPCESVCSAFPFLLPGTYKHGRPKRNRAPSELPKPSTPAGQHRSYCQSCFLPKSSRLIAHVVVASLSCSGTAKQISSMRRKPSDRQAGSDICNQVSKCMLFWGVIRPGLRTPSLQSGGGERFVIQVDGGSN